uniref:Uncharacterized protein n=1 Tax=Arundo donax TaxID=35708 RepID=A0A0A9G0M3_ARUDO
MCVYCVRVRERLVGNKQTALCRAELPFHLTPPNA